MPVNPAEKILFTGDAINKSVQPIHYDYPNIKQWTDSMQSAMDLGPTLYLPGHGEPFKTDYGQGDHRLLRRP